MDITDQISPVKTSTCTSSDAARLRALIPPKTVDTDLSSVETQKIARWVKQLQELPDIRLDKIEHLTQSPYGPEAYAHVAQCVLQDLCS